jgi:hypothetical protein
VSKARLAIALSVAIVVWAVPGSGAAQTLLPVKLREQDRGLLATAWINAAGPFVFAIDTGAGVSLISRNVVERARLQVTKSRRPLVGGLSTSPIASYEETRLSSLALGQPNNRISTTAIAAVVANLPGSIDGILDPTDVFSPFGYSVDLPHRELQVFQGKLRTNDNPPGGAVVHWIGKDRPFVRLGDGRLALIDTGSGFGLVLNEPGMIAGRNHGQVENRTDLGGGRVQSRGIAPQRIDVGNLVLNGVPTDVLTGVAPGTPIILGRRALFPFKITFDPVSRLIAFEPTER